MCPTCDKEVEVVIPTGGGGNVTGKTLFFSKTENYIILCYEQGFW
jgi:hypothetical protein